MEGRPPFDPDDELDFDFDSPRRRQAERADPARGDDEPQEPVRDPEPPSEEAPHESGGGYSEPPSSAEHPISDEFPTSGEYSTSSEYPAVDPFDTSERRARREPRKRGLRLPGSRKRRDRERRARATDTGERPIPVTGTDTGERPVATGDTGSRPPVSDDPFDTGEAAAARRERRRHADLPAKVRRRQAAGIAVIALIVLIGGYVLVNAVAGGGGDDEEEPLALKRLAGQTIVGKVGKAGPDQDLLRRVKKGQIGGVILTAPRSEAVVTQQVSQLQNAADAGGSPPLLVMIDQEGGDVKRLPGPPDVAPPSLGDTGDPDAARTVGEETGTYLKGAGVNVNLAPVMDVRQPTTADTIAERTYSDDPAVVSEIGSAFIEGMQANGVAATAKHFPGLGPATVNTDFAPTTIAARDEVLEEALQPFQAAVDAGVALVMISSANYPSYGPENPKDPNKPANAVKDIVQNELRTNMGFEGLVITDDLQSIAIETLTSPSAAGVAALGAGCDLILYARSDRGSEEALTSVTRAIKKGNLDRAQIQASYDRIVALKERLASGSG